MLGRSVWELFPHKDTQFEIALRSGMNERTTVRFEEYCALLDKWFEGTVYPSSAGVTVYVRDITERKRAEEEKRESNRRIRDILESITDAFVAVDRD